MVTAVAEEMRTKKEFPLALHLLDCAGDSAAAVDSVLCRQLADTMVKNSTHRVINLQHAYWRAEGGRWLTRLDTDAAVMAQVGPELAEQLRLLMRLAQFFDLVYNER